jgi:hypothetical protein
MLAVNLDGHTVKAVPKTRRMLGAFDVFDGKAVLGGKGSHRLLTYLDIIADRCTTPEANAAPAKDNVTPQRKNALYHITAFD